VKPSGVRREAPLRIDLKRAGARVCTLALATVAALPLLSGCRGEGEPPPAGILRTATVTDVPTLDPAAGYDTTSWLFEQMLFSTLLDYDDEGALVAEAAERWEVDPTGTVYTFHLDPRLRFSSGRRVVAADVKYSLERVLAPATRSQGAEFFRGLEGADEFVAGTSAGVRGIEVEGEDVVRLRLRRFDPVFVHAIALQFAAIVPREEVERSGDDFSSHPVGSGPFLLRQWRRGQSLSLRRNPHYFRPGEPRLDGIEHLVGVNEQLEWLKFEAGELDVADIPASEYPLVARDPAYRGRLVSKTAMRTSYLGINCGMAPFGDARVRRAVAHAIDRDKALALINRRGRAATSLVPPGIAGWDEGAPVPRHDPEAARALLREAGLEEGVDTALWVRTDETLLRLAQSYQQDLAEVGVRARIRNLSWASFLELIRRPGRAPLFMLGWEADFPDASNYLEVLLHSRSIGANNYSFFSDAEFDALLDRAATALDPGARLDLLRRAERHMLPQAPLVPLFYPVEVQAVAPRVRNYRLNPLRPPRFEKVEVVG